MAEQIAPTAIIRLRFPETKPSFPFKARFPAQPAMASLGRCSPCLPR
jgi:hypothetical protein